MGAGIAYISNLAFHGNEDAGRGEYLLGRTFPNARHGDVLAPLLAGLGQAEPYGRAALPNAEDQWNAG